MLIFYTKGAYAPYLFPIVILNGFFIYIIYLSYINFKFTFLTNEKTPEVPSSLLKDFPKLYFFLDEAAASKLDK